VEGSALRLFFALPLPEPLRKELGQWQKGHPGIQGWSRPEGLHLTLAFLGERPAKALGVLERIGGGVSHGRAPFELRTAELGGFPRAEATRVLWLGLEPSPALEVLVTDLRIALEAAGEVFDGKSFRPHLTLARFRRPRSLAAFKAPSPAAFQADQLVLFESRTGAGYLPLITWSLR